VELEGIDVAVLAGAAGIFLLLAGAVIASRRALVRRLSALAVRLEPQGSDDGHRRGLEAAVNRLERGAGQAASRVDDATIGVERFSRALAAVDQGVVVCDEQGEVIFRNDGAAAFVGARHADALAEQAVSELLAAARGGEARQRTLQLWGPPRRTLTITGVPLDDGWRNIGAAAVIEDVSERWRLDAVRRDFVANVSHELKTPVSALGLLAETLAAQDDPAVIHRLSHRMQEEAFRVNRVIEDLLDLSRIESEERPARELIPVHLIVAEAVERVRSVADLRGVDIQVEEPPHDDAVLGDRRQLVSALHNLLENAVKYSDAGSTVEVDVVSADDAVDVVVRDRGIGIPTRDLDRIFERFYRVDRARSRDTGGSGLGLAIVRHVAHSHQGDVLVESHEGEGSTFTLRLPALPGPMGIAAEAG